MASAPTSWLRSRPPSQRSGTLPVALAATTPGDSATAGVPGAFPRSGRGQRRSPTTPAFSQGAGLGTRPPTRSMAMRPVTRAGGTRPRGICGISSGSRTRRGIRRPQAHTRHSRCGASQCTASRVAEKYPMPAFIANPKMEISHSEEIRTGSREIQLAWTAGFLEGEGSFMLWREVARISASQAERQSLELLQHLYGGSVSPHAQKRNNRFGKGEFWTWTLVGRRAADLAIALRPLMSERRQAQIDHALSGAGIQRDPRRGLKASPHS